MIPDKKEAEAKRIFIAMIVVGILILVFDYFFIKFIPEPPPQKGTGTITEEEMREKLGRKEEKKEDLPTLMLGTTREKKEPVETVTYRFGNFSLEVSPQGGRIVRFVDGEFGFDLVTEVERKLKVFPLEVYTGDPDLDQKLNFGRYTLRREGNRLLMHYEGEGIKLTKVLEFRDFYFLLRIESDSDRKLYVLAGTHPDEESFYTHQGPVLKIGDDVLRIDPDDVQGKQSYEGEIHFAGEESRYFFKGFKGKIDRVVVDRISYRDGEEEKFATFTYVRYSEPLTLYMGAKYYSRLRDIDLGDLLDYGMLRIVVKPLFLFMYWVFEHTGSWILSIVILTLILRIVFFPLNYKSTTSMMKLQEAAPKLEKLRKKYKDDPAKLQQEMMKLYSEIGANPMSGCLPILVQIPVFFALYKVLIITVDLKLTGMLWIPSLADKDPFYLLPIVMGLTMILQQKLMPSPDPKQNLIMYISAVAFTFLFANFPSGLVLYWTVNNILNIGQNYLIKNVILKRKK